MRKFLHYVIILALSLFASCTVASAIGRDDFEVFNTTEFEEVCGLQDADFYSRGHTCLVKKSYLESDAGKSLLGRMEKCMDAYRSGNPGASPGKPRALLEVLRRNSLGETYWTSVDFLKGGKYILVTKDEIGGGRMVSWACIDYEGNMVVPLGRGVYDGDTDMDALIFREYAYTAENGTRIYKSGLMHNDGTIALEAKYGVVWLINKRWIIVSPDGRSDWEIYDKDYNLKMSGMTKVVPFKYTYSHTDRVTNFFVLTDKKGKVALYNGALRQITEYKFDGWLNESPYWLGCEGDPLAYNYTCVIDTRTWQELDRIPKEYWNHRFEEK